MLKCWCLSFSVFLLAWWINFSTPPRPVPLVNYDSVVFFDKSPPNGPLPVPQLGPEAPSYLAPRTREELVTIVKAVAATHKGDGPKRKMHVLGSGHSWSAVAQSDDLLLTLSNYRGLVSVDRATKQATFRAGTTLKEVNSILEDYGLAMSQLGSISDQTVAGAIGTGTHGSGIKIGNLATFVVRLELVTGQGQVLTVSATDNTDIFRAAQVSVGLLGVVTEVAFQCESAFNLEETRSELLPLSHCLDDMLSVAHSAQYVKIWAYLYADNCSIYRSNKTDAEPRDNPSHFVGIVKNVLFEAYMYIFSWIPSIFPGAMKLIVRYSDGFPAYNRVDKSCNVLNIPHYIVNHHELEVVLDVRHCAAAITELKYLLPLTFLFEVRFVQSDNIFLSPNYQRDSCHLTIMIVYGSERERLDYFKVVFDALSKKGLEPRVHWGKYFDLRGVKVSDLYPNLNRFLEIRDKLDPDKIFVNSLLSSTLGIL